MSESVNVQEESNGSNEEIAHAETRILDYEFVLARKTWVDARRTCKARGGGLLTIHSGRENVHVASLFDQD